MTGPKYKYAHDIEFFGKSLPTFSMDAYLDRRSESGWRLVSVVMGPTEGIQSIPFHFFWERPVQSRRRKADAKA